MDYHIFHSTQVEDSRNLVAFLGGDPLNKGTQTLAASGDAITVTGFHADNVAINPNIPGYPYVTFKNGDQEVGLFAPASWDVVKAWAPPAVPTPAKPTTLSSYAFTSRFTDAEAVAIETAAANNPVIRVAERKLGLVKDWDVDLTNPSVIQYVGYLVTKALLTQDRATAILTP